MDLVTFTEENFIFCAVKVRKTKNKLVEVLTLHFNSAFSLCLFPRLFTLEYVVKGSIIFDSVRNEASIRNFSRVNQLKIKSLLKENIT